MPIVSEVIKLVLVLVSSTLMISVKKKALVLEVVFYIHYLV